MEIRTLNPESSAARIVAVLRRRFEDRRRKARHRQASAVAASLELGPQMELRDFMALLDDLAMSLEELSRELDSAEPVPSFDEPVNQLCGVGMERWLEEIRQIRKRVAASERAG